MIKLRFGDLVSGIAVIAPMQRRWESEPHGRQLFDNHQYKHAIKIMRDLHSALSESEMAISAKHAQGLLSAFERATVEGSQFVLAGESLSYATHYLNRLVGALEDEATQKHFLSISAAASQYLDVAPVEDSIALSFPDALFDLEEAAKCMGVERWTAAIFHLMRAMEVAVRMLAERLGATVASQHGETLAWGPIVSNLKAKIDALPKGSKQDEWYKCHALLHSVNRAYRTKTAHPAAKYTQQEAQDAFAATHGFLRELAEI